MKKLSDFIKQASDEAVFISEGLDIDYSSFTVSFTDDHEKDVDTSLERNPTKERLFGVDVWSIFKRTNKSTSQNGNPLAYLLKGEGRWRWGRGKEAFLQRLKDVMRKYASSHHNVVVTVPSSSSLNIELARLYCSADADADLNTDVLIKLSNEEVLDNFCGSDEAKEYFGDGFAAACRALDYSMLESQRKYHDDVFRIHTVKNSDIRNLIKTIMKENVDADIDYFDKDVLIIDDVISRGVSIENAINIIKNYGPKSITVLTLMSRQIY